MPLGIFLFHQHTSHHILHIWSCIQVLLRSLYTRDPSVSPTIVSMSQCVCWFKICWNFIFPKHLPQLLRKGSRHDFFSWKWLWLQDQDRWVCIMICKRLLWSNLKTIGCYYDIFLLNPESDRNNMSYLDFTQGHHHNLLADIKINDSLSSVVISHLKQSHTITRNLEYFRDNIRAVNDNFSVR